MPPTPLHFSRPIREVLAELADMAARGVGCRSVHVGDPAAEPTVIEPASVNTQTARYTEVEEFG